MKVKVSVDGKDIPLNDFASKVVGRTALGLVSSLKYVDRPRRVTIDVELEETNG